MLGTVLFTWCLTSTNLLRITGCSCIDDMSNEIDALQNQKATVDNQMKRMFPKQYGLENVFSPTQISSGSISYATLSSGVFKLGASKARKKAAGTWRLRAMRTLVEEMLVLNQMCRFKALLRYYCPAEVRLFFCLGLTVVSYMYFLKFS
jgi:hypothetical protein